MAFGLNKADAKRRDGYVDDLREKAKKLHDAIAEYQTKLLEIRGPVEEALAEYNEVLDEARGFIEDIANNARGEWDDKSEKWQEDEKGQAVSAWIDSFDECELEDVEVPFPEDLEYEEPDHADNLEGLSVDPEY